MIFINPWAFYDPDDIPNLTPRDDEEMVEFLAGACGFIVSSIIYVSMFYLCFNFTEGVLRPLLVTIVSAVIYPVIIIYLMGLSFKIGKKFIKRKENERLYRYRTK